MSPLYETMFTRRSVRHFAQEPLTSQMLDEVLMFAKGLKPLDPAIRVAFTVTDEAEGMYLIKAPQYLCLYSGNTPHYLENAGYLLQQVDLYLSSRGLGSCWLGLAKPQCLQLDGLSYVVMLAFGTPEMDIHRHGKEQFKRAALCDITDVEGAEELLEPVRLAPSAHNSQPWFFTGNPQELLAFRQYQPDADMTRLNKIDMGIAFCHLALAAEHQGKSSWFDFTPVYAPEGRTFSATIHMR